EPGGDGLVDRRTRPGGRTRYLPRLHCEAGIDFREREIARRLEIVEQAVERAQMRVADGGGGCAVRCRAAGNALLEDDRRSRCRGRGSGRSEAEVVHLGGEALCRTVGRSGAAVYDLGPGVCRRSGVEACRAAARTVAAVAEEVEFGDCPAIRGIDGVVTVFG